MFYFCLCDFKGFRTRILCGEVFLTIKKVFEKRLLIHNSYLETLEMLNVDITDTQLAEYNKKNLQAFMDCYATDIKVFMLQSGQMITEGKDQLHKIMKESFDKDTGSQTTVLSKVVQGNLIINQEEITGHELDKIIRTISIYEVEHGLIQKLWFGGRTTIESK